MSKPALTDLLHAAVTAVGGTERPGQIAMAEAVAEAVDSGTHLLIQAGTGTGKSLGYLVPALAHGEHVVVATATLALQRQLVERDLPRTVDALHPLLRRRAEFAMLKGRSNYLCLHRLHEGVPQDEEEGLFDPFEGAAPTSSLGKDRCACATGRTRRRRETGTTCVPASRTGPGNRSRSPRASAWARPSARTARSVSRRPPASGPSSPTSS
jgi:ATP-dependent DNA helicase DinG